jgi:hypothetical protein
MVVDFSVENLVLGLGLKLVASDFVLAFVGEHPLAGKGDLGWERQSLFKA